MKNTPRKIAVVGSCTQTFFAVITGMSGFLIPCVLAAVFAVVFAVVAANQKEDECPRK